MSEDDNKEAEQERTWVLLYDRIRSELQRFGSEGIRDTTDCWVDDDNIGTRQQKVYVRNLRLLMPAVITALQRIVRDWPEWEIMVAVYVPGTGEDWPDMGLTIRAHEIVDGLQRSFFPKQFQGLRYEGSRTGTDRD